MSCTLISSADYQVGEKNRIHKYIKVNMDYVLRLYVIRQFPEVSFFLVLLTKPERCYQKYKRISKSQ
jgi:hypothetical protein